MRGITTERVMELYQFAAGLTDTERTVLASAIGMLKHGAVLQNGKKPVGRPRLKAYRKHTGGNGCKQYTPEEDRAILDGVEAGKSFSTIARELKRRPGAVYNHYWVKLYRKPK